MRRIKGRNFRQKPTKDKYRVNDQIFANEVRVIDDDGKMLGVFPVREALDLAQNRSLDLIEIAPNAAPPTCKIMDYGKWKYESKKKAQAAKKKQTTITVKEIQMRPRTDEHDLDVKLKHAQRFLLAGDKVKVNLRFHGRELAHQEVGVKLLERVIKKLENISTAEALPKMEGRQLFIIVAPDNAKIKEFKSKLKDEKAFDEEVLEPLDPMDVSEASESVAEEETPATETV